jgi:hypothetical protein
MTDPEVRVGRCQHCQQVRPVFHYDHRHDNGDHIWDQPYPPYWPTTGAWLCARDWSTADTCRANGHSFHVDHEIEVEDWRERRGWPGRIFTPGGELLTQTDRDLKTCEAILAATP